MIVILLGSDHSSSHKNSIRYGHICITTAKGHPCRQNSPAGKTHDLMVYKPDGNDENCRKYNPCSNILCNYTPILLSFPSGICYITENAITSKYSHHNINHRMPSGQIKRKHLYMCQQITANNAGKNYQIPFAVIASGEKNAEKCQYQYLHRRNKKRQYKNPKH